MKKIQLHPAMGAQVLERLAEFGALPERGVVAGQAVASAIQDLYGLGGGVYNDVDVFRLVGAKTRDQSQMALKTTELTKAMWSPHFEEKDEYSRLDAFLQSMRSYRVSSVSRDNMVNYINCALPIEAGRHLSASRVIESFDLNCVRVAVDLESKQLVWDRHFARFLHSHQLEIVAVHTPWHTFLRLLKKLEELPGAYADVPACAEVAAAVSQSRHYKSFIDAGSVTRNFGEKAKELAEKHRSIWTPYFDLGAETLTIAGKDIDLYSMEPRGQVDSPLMDRVNELEGAALHYCAQAVYAARRKKSAATVVKLDTVVKQVASIQPVYSRHCIRRFISVQQERYVEGVVSPGHVEQVARFVHAHSEMLDAMADMTLDEQLNCIKRLKKFEAEFGLWIYGALGARVLATDLAHDHCIRKILEDFKEENVKPINVTPLSLPALPLHWVKAGVVVEELLRPVDLTEEGEELGHCVGGYSNQVRTGMCRIVRIRTSAKKDDWSTVEFAHRSGRSITSGKELCVVQHRGRFNQEPAELNVKVVQFLELFMTTEKYQLTMHKVGLYEPVLKLKAMTYRYALDAAWKALTKVEKACCVVGQAIRRQRTHAEKLKEKAILFDYAKPVGEQKKAKPKVAQVARPRPGFLDLDDDQPF